MSLVVFILCRGKDTHNTDRKKYKNKKSIYVLLFCYFYQFCNAFSLLFIAYFRQFVCGVLHNTLVLYVVLDVCSNQYWSSVETVIRPVHTSFILMWKTQLDEFSFLYHVSGNHMRCSSLWVKHNGRRSASVWNVAPVTPVDILAPVDVYVCIC